MSEPGYVAPPDPTARRWHFYALGSGIFTGQTLSAPALALAANTPAGCGVYESAPGARPDILAQRVDLATGKLIDYQPPAPANDAMQTWAWDTGIKRWVSQPTLAAIKRDRRQAMAAAWNADREAGVTVGTKVAPTDAMAWTRYLAIQAMASDASAWTDVPIPLLDGTFELLTKAKAAALWAALKDMERTLLARLKARVEAIAAAGTAAEVNAVTW